MSGWVGEVDHSWSKHTLSDLAEVGLSGAKEDLVLDVLVRLRLVAEWCDGALVVGTRALVVECHETVALEVRDWRNGRIDGELGVIDTETVT